MLHLHTGFKHNFNETNTLFLAGLIFFFTKARTQFPPFRVCSSISFFQSDQFEVNLEKYAEGKSPKIKKRESMAFDHTLHSSLAIVSVLILAGRLDICENW